MELKQVYFLVTYRRKVRFRRKDGSTVWFKSRVNVVDAFVGCEDSQENLKTAFDRAEDHELFRAGWECVVLPIQKPQFNRWYSEIVGEVVK